MSTRPVFVARPAGARPQRRHLTVCPSAELAVAAQAGDPDAAGELYRRTHRRARRAARAYCREIDADDAVAEGMTRALGRIGQLRDPAAVEAWMIRCVVRSAVDLTRKRQRLRLAPSEDADALLEQARPAQESADVGAMAVLDRATMALAVGELPTGLRQLLSLRYEAGLSVADVALALGRPAGTVRRQCVEARRAAGQQFLARHLRPAVGACAEMTDVLCQEPYRLPSLRARRKAVEHLRRCRACRDRKAEVAAILDELGYEKRPAARNEPSTGTHRSAGERAGNTPTDLGGFEQEGIVAERRSNHMSLGAHAEQRHEFLL